VAHASPSALRGRFVARASPPARVFIFFSNNLGCLGSVLVSLIGTLILLILLHVI
jgi:hypothetical protein